MQILASTLFDVGSELAMWSAEVIQNNQSVIDACLGAEH